MSQKKTILVTGAAGFIGFHTAKAFAKRGDRVIGFDNFNPYYSPALKKKRAHLLQKEMGVEVIEGELSNPKALDAVFDKYRFTHVLHLAAQAGVRYAQKHPEAYIKSNINGFLAILEKLRHHPHIKLIYASSSSVYGRNDKIPFSIQDSTDRPANLYATTKKANELMAYTYSHLYGIQAIGLRYFTVYGPWGRPDMAYFSFTKSILENKPIQLFNQGKMKRDFTYIDDIVEGTLAATDYKGKGVIFNLGNNQPVELMVFLSILENKLGVKAKKEFLGPSLGEVEITYADISLSHEKLNFTPKTSLEEGLDRFVDWYLAYHVQPRSQFTPISPR